MQQANYMHSAYMPDNTTGDVATLLEATEYARVLHLIDILRVKMQVLDDAGCLSQSIELFAMEAIDRRSLMWMRAAVKQIDAAIDAMAM